MLDVGNPDEQTIAEDITIILRNDLQHAINTVDETRRQAAVSRAAQPKYATQHPPGGGKGSTYERAANKGKGKGGGTSSKGKGKSPANAEAANPRHNDAGWSWDDWSWWNWSSNSSSWDWRRGQGWQWR